MPSFPTFPLMCSKKSSYFPGENWNHHWSQIRPFNIFPICFISINFPKDNIRDLDFCWQFVPCPTQVGDLGRGMTHWHYSPGLHSLVSVWYLQPAFSRSRDPTSPDPNVSSQQQEHAITQQHAASHKNLPIHNEGFVAENICLWFLLFPKWGFNYCWLFFSPLGSNCFHWELIISLSLAAGMLCLGLPALLR